MRSDVGEKLRRQVADAAYHVCEYCLVHEDDTYWGCQVDHIISRKHGGDSKPGNLAWACAICNSNKGSDIASFGRKSRKLARLFHPRLDRWLAHFHLSETVIESTGDVGHATVTMLRLNNSHRVEERTALADVGRYPTVEAMARMNE